MWYYKNMAQTTSYSPGTHHLTSHTFSSTPPLFYKASPLLHYIDIIKKNDFNLLLSDGSVIQIAYKIFSEEIQWHRLCFFPCPIAFSDEELTEYTILDLFDVLSPEELIARTKMVTYVRFDFDRNFSDERHAHSHFTFGNSDCRVPVYGPISITHFAEFIIQNFLASRFDIPNYQGFGQSLYGRTLPLRHSHPLFLESAAQ